MPFRDSTTGCEALENDTGPLTFRAKCKASRPSELRQRGLGLREQGGRFRLGVGFSGAGVGRAQATSTLP